MRQQAHGDFVWRRFYSMLRAGVQGIHISMYDECNEGNQIAKTAESLAWSPGNSGMPERYAALTGRDLSRLPSYLAFLDAQLTSWDGRPAARWRKRLARHVRDCPQCLSHTSELLPAEGLLGGFALVPVPIGLAGLLLAKATPSASAGAAGAAAHAPDSAGRVAHLLGKLAAKPVATLTAGMVALAGGGALHAYTRSDVPVRRPAAQAPASPAASSSPPAPTASATPPPASTAASTLVGRHALRSVDRSGRFVRETGDLGVLGPVSAASPALAKQEATFRFVAGLADSRCYSLRDAAGRYLRHYAFRIRLDADDGSAIFRKDATFCARSGSANGSVSLEAYNYPGRYLRHRDNFELWLDPARDTGAFRASASFTVVAPWT